jgi:hypothetical protein
MTKCPRKNGRCFSSSWESRDVGTADRTGTPESSCTRISPSMTAAARHGIAAPTA